VSKSSPTRAAIYARVSTTDQTTKNQVRQLTSYCENRGLKVMEVFEDTGISGSQDSRPGLDALMKQARQGKYDAVVVWKFDRFARSTAHLLQALTEFQSLGVDFISFSEGIDTSSPRGKLIYTFLAGIAEFERSLIRERVKAGIERAQEAGIHCGRPRKGFDIARAVKLSQAGLVEFDGLPSSWEYPNPQSTEPFGVSQKPPSLNQPDTVPKPPFGTEVQNQ